MSSKLNHEATMYFLEKNARNVQPDYLFAFGVKQIMRCQLNGESKDIIRQYTQFLKKFSTQLSLKNRVILLLLRSKLLNVSYLYRLRKLLGK